MLYLRDQFPSAAVRLKDIRHDFISARFELFNCASIVTLPTDIGSSSVSPIIIGRTLGFAGEGQQHVLLTSFSDTGREIFDFSCRIFVLALLVQ